MVVYIPYEIYSECNFKEESMVDFIRTVIREYCLVDGVDKDEIKEAIKHISMIDYEFDT